VESSRIRASSLWKTKVLANLSVSAQEKLN
jgi:hypothetical protein